MTRQPAPRPPLSSFTPRLLPLVIAALMVAIVLRTGDVVLAAVDAHAAEKAADKPPAAQGDKHGTAKPEAPPQADAGKAATFPPIPVPQGEVVPTPAEHPVTDQERALLIDLRKRREVLDAREAQLNARDATLQAMQTRLQARFDELKAMQARLDAAEQQRKAQDETNWQGLVKVYETMKPRDAAVIFDDLDMAVLLPVIDRMKEAKAAQILAAMTADRARLVTTELARLRESRNGTPQPATSAPTPAPAPATPLGPVNKG